MLEITLFLLVLLVVLLVRAYRHTYGYWIGHGIPYVSFPEYIRSVYDQFYNKVREHRNSFE